MAVAVFDFAAWQTRYPEFGAAVSSDMAATLFDEAGMLYLDNTDASPITSIPRRLMLLNMIVAHLASLSGALEVGGKPSGLVGRVKSASEGSVRVEVDAGLEPGSASWWTQTPYGFSYYWATKRQRGARYVAPCQPVFEPYGVIPWRRY